MIRGGCLPGIGRDGIDDDHPDALFRSRSIFLEHILRLLDDLFVCFGKVQWYFDVLDALVLVADAFPTPPTGT